MEATQALTAVDEIFALSAVDIVTWIKSPKIVETGIGDMIVDITGEITALSSHQAEGKHHILLMPYLPCFIFEAHVGREQHVPRPFTP